MKYLYARRRPDDRWEFVSDCNGQVNAVGYCIWGHSHATEKESRACYRQWLLDHKTNLRGRTPGRRDPCVECGTLTDRYAAVGHWVRALCDRHCTRPVVEKIYPEIIGIIRA
jgi:hypothetical protein